MNSKIKFKLIEGGLPEKEHAEKEFVSAFVTDTRLMGQVAMGIHWKILDHPDAEDLYQFFSFDAEECGLDNYKSVWDGDVSALDYIRQTMIGPLGGEDIIISEKEARALFTYFYAMNKQRGFNFREGIHEFRFLIDNPVYLEKEESDALLGKMCTEITTDYQLVNYYIMRMVAKDYRAAAYLSAVPVDENLFSDLPLVTLLKNTIHSSEDGYVSHSLVEYDGVYKILLTEIKTSNRKVLSCTRSTGLDVTYKEAALMMARPEFLTVYKILTGPEEFEEKPMVFKYNTMITEHDNGRMYMAFNKSNDHVNSREFIISGDIFGLYFITYSGEFIVAAPGKASIIQMERDLLHSDIGAFLFPVGKFEFQEPVLLQFANSGLSEFEDFLEAITDE